jgi:hypothetical protein
MTEEIKPAEPAKQDSVGVKTGCITAIAVVGGIVTIITGALRITEFASSHWSKVTAEVSLARFSAPPALLRDREKLQTLRAKPETLEKQLDLSSCDQAHRSAIARDIARFFLDALPFAAGDSFSDPTEVWYADIKNNSDSTCEQVTITLPGTNAVAIEREGKAVEYREINEVLDIGDLRPTELVKVTGWARMVIDEDKLKLVHKTGVGEVKRTRALSPDWKLISDLWSGCALEFFVALFLLILGWLAVRKILKNVRAASERK